MVDAYPQTVSSTATAPRQGPVDQFDEKLALLIGISKYAVEAEFGPLDAPPRDVINVKEYLLSHTIWDDKNMIDDVTHPSTQQVRDKFSELHGEIKAHAKKRKRVALFIYLSGHGVFDQTALKTCLVGPDQDIIPVEEYIDNCTQQWGVFSVCIMQGCRTKKPLPKLQCGGVAQPRTDNKAQRFLIFTAHPGSPSKEIRSGSLVTSSLLAKLSTNRAPWPDCLAGWEYKTQTGAQFIDETRDKLQTATGGGAFVDGIPIVDASNAMTHAVLIGLGDYEDGAQWSPLDAPQRDVLNVKQYLKESTVWQKPKTLTNRPTAEIIERLSGLRTLANVAAENNQQLLLFIYVSGHGVFDTVSGKTCLVGLDSQLIPVEDLIDNCTLQKGVISICIFECCRAALKIKDKTQGSSIVKRDKEANCLFIFSSQVGKLSWGTPAGSQVTNSLLKQLRSNSLPWPDCITTWEMNAPGKAQVDDQFRVKLSRV